MNFVWQKVEPQTVLRIILL